jgi:hypothetical protein
MATVPPAIDRFLPEFDRTAIEQVVVAADAARTHAAIGTADLGGDLALDVVGSLRSLPERLAHWRLGIEEPPREKRTFDGLFGGDAAWIDLADEPGEHRVVGLVARVSFDERRLENIGPAEFRAFRAPGFVKIAVSLTTRPGGDGATVLACEVRARATDAETRSTLDRLWALAGGALRLLIRRALGAIRDEAEGSAGMQT